jgi:hypothetical protein
MLCPVGANFVLVDRSRLLRQIKTSSSFQIKIQDQQSDAMVMAYFLIAKTNLKPTSRPSCMCKLEYQSHYKVKVDIDDQE